MQISDLDQWLEERNLNGFWNRQSRLPVVKPYLWKGADIYEGLQRAAELIPMDRTGRRVIQLRNPSLEAGMSNTIHLALQRVNPGEIAEAHRHVVAAIRYIVKGSPNCFTIVEGERFALEEGDLITTPNWTWHDHYNGSSEPVIWLDGLDARLVSYLGAQYTEEFVQQQQPVEKPDGYSTKIMGHVRPTWMKTEHPTPPFRYRWDETYSTLLALKESEGDPFDGIRLRYVNPFNGGPTLPTFSCELQLLRPKEKTRSHRHTSTTAYHAFRGQGVTTVEQEIFRWDQGDFFIIPSWRWHSHENPSTQDAILFSINDWPTMSALGLYREEGATNE